MFAMCCSPVSEEVDQVVFDSTTDEHLSMPVLQAPPAAIPTLLAYHANGKPLSGDAGPAAVNGPNLARLAEEVEKENTSLAGVATKGRRCTRFSEATGARMETEYLVDDPLRRLVVKIPGLPAQPEVVCPVDLIEDIYTIDDGEECFPPKVLVSLSHEERDGIFLIVYVEPVAGGTNRSDDEPVSLCLVEASRKARDDVLEHLKTLSLSVPRQ
mmetsp:Transcript_115592/g.288868  ORF Transcript_115592/g.288868 Transcript_115592/m.288868 type:complete len:213 (+) Transcript_115592:116-754(+)